MGAKYEFVCSRCSYQSTVSGGADRGWCAKTRTVSCPDCQEVFDVFEGKVEGMADDEPWTVPPAPTGICPRCGNSRIVPWPTTERPCPKCGSRMDRGELSCLWD